MQSSKLSSTDGMVGMVGRLGGTVNCGAGKERLRTFGIHSRRSGLTTVRLTSMRRSRHTLWTRPGALRRPLKNRPMAPLFRFRHNRFQPQILVSLGRELTALRRSSLGPSLGLLYQFLHILLICLTKYHVLLTTLCYIFIYPSRLPRRGRPSGGERRTNGIH
jgi:hypothetical protein